MIPLLARSRPTNDGCFLEVGVADTHSDSGNVGGEELRFLRRIRASTEVDVIAAERDARELP